MKIKDLDPFMAVACELAALVWSDFQDRYINENDVVKWCEGCERPLTETEMEDDLAVHTHYGSTYCHKDCFEDCRG